MSEYKSRIIKNSQLASTNAAFYDDRWAIEWLGIDGFKKIRGNFAKQCIQDYSQSKSLHILEVGCGFAWMSLFLSEFGHYVGVDYSKKAIDYACCVYSKYGEFYVANPNEVNLGLPEELFDIIVASEVIEHVQDHAAFFAQIDLFLKHGGLFVLTTPNRLLYNTISKKYPESMQPAENWLTPIELRDLLKAGGFRVIRHNGALARTCRYGWRDRIVSWRLEKLSRILRLGKLYDRLLLRNSMYQFLAAVKN